MKKKDIMIISCAAVALLGFFLPWASYGSRSLSGAGVLARLLDKGFLSGLKDLLRLIAIFGLPLSALGAAVLVILKKGFAACGLMGITAFILLFLIADGFTVFGFADIGLYITLAAAAAAPAIRFGVKSEQ